MDYEIPNDQSAPDFTMCWNSNMRPPDLSKLDDKMDRNIDIMLKELGYGIQR